MPTYEYACRNGHVTEAFRSIDERDNAPKCDACGTSTRKMISAVRGFVSFPAGGGQEYVSPSSGRYITSLRQRRDDLARTDCRPYEGFESEKKAAAARVQEQERKSDAKLHEAVSRAYHALPPSKKKALAA